MKKFTLPVALTATLLALSSTVSAQKVVFPQQQQAGIALLEKNANQFILRNELLKASFRLDGNRLLFDGCPQLDLKSGTELFEVRVGNGSQTLKASDFQLVGDVREVNYVTNAQAVKGSEKFAGKALEATFKYNDLQVIWRAVLRDGSHYLRTELELSAVNDFKMFSITPMLYEVDVLAAKTTPKVVGNTRGAVLVSDKIFAGLETPMGINSLDGANVARDFDYDRWTANSFIAPEENTIPTGVKALGYPDDQVLMTEGYLNFLKSGEQTLKFAYTSGSHRLNILGVDVLSMDGQVVAHDYHFGFTGNAQSKNTYQLQLPNAGSYKVRYYVASPPGDEVTSRGTITFSNKVLPISVLADLAPGSASQLVGDNISTADPSTAPSGYNVIENGDVATYAWKTSGWNVINELPQKVKELAYEQNQIHTTEQTVFLAANGKLTTEFKYNSGSNALHLVGVDLVDNTGNVVASEYHIGSTGNKSNNNVYTFEVTHPGAYTLRFLASNKEEAFNSEGKATVKLLNTPTLHVASPSSTTMRGLWSRNTQLKKGDTWKVSAVVGLVAKNQARRSFLAYSERERAVPWRPFSLYNSWYELNIDRNNDRNYTGNMHDYQCDDIVEEWKKQLYDRYHIGINSFVWDDGWDNYGTWTFSPNFPNGFDKSNELAKEMGSGIGAWLGPVGGYGTSGTYRRSYWNGKGGMQLSNSAYYKVFTDAITDLCNGRGYDFRYFKFDGISAQGTAVGPDGGTVGEENAEGIINAERMVRETIKSDIFFNTSVGTWASPFWFRYTDAVWRQENDASRKGNQGDDREQWITYRDELVHRHFVTNSPICPINTLMTHGFILSDFGRPHTASSKNYDGIVREMRCAFACGSSMVELYSDYALMNSINGGRLWGDLAECLRWQETNADVLPDVHWVGGNPWNGSRSEVYGWASWNGPKGTLALRNGQASPQTFKTTLRKALEIPEYVHDKYILVKSFGTQPVLPNIPENQALDIDQELTFDFPASSVYVFDIRRADVAEVPTIGVEMEAPTLTLPPNREQAIAYRLFPENATHRTLTWTSDNPTVVSVKDGVIQTLQNGEATITLTNAGGQSATMKVVVGPVSYGLNFRESEKPAAKGRVLSQLTFTPEKSAPFTLTMPKVKKAFKDFTDTPYEVEAGELIVPNITWKGTWMHGYLYMDTDQNGYFDVEQITDPELLTCTFYEKQQKRDGAISQQLVQNIGATNLSAFKAPSQPGLYRLRYKIDWNNIDPAGTATGKNNALITNGGQVVDFTIKVVIPTGIANAKTETHQSKTTYDLSGRISTTASKGQVIIEGGKKVIK